MAERAPEARSVPEDATQQPIIKPKIKYRGQSEMATIHAGHSGSGNPRMVNMAAKMKDVIHSTSQTP